MSPTHADQVLAGREPRGRRFRDIVSQPVYEMCAKRREILHLAPQRDIVNTGRIGPIPDL